MRNINYRPIELYTIKKFSDRPMPRSHYGTCAALIKASCRTICLGDRAIFTHTLLCVHQSVFV